MVRCRRIEFRRGQALLELACGMFAVALVVSALCGFAVYLTKSLELQNEVRRGNANGSLSASVQFDSFATDWIFMKSTWNLEERVKLPSWTIEGD